MNAEGPSKAEAFVEFARLRGWEAHAHKITHRDYPDKRYVQAGWTVIARLGPEVITATWIDEVAIGPIGWHSTPNGQTPIANQATARRLIDADADAAR